MTNANYTWHEFATQSQLAGSLAERVVKQLQAGIEQRGQAIIALSGGSTPKPLFIELSKAELDWSKVVVTLVDERWVPFDDERSNTAFLHQHLLSDLPSPARLVSLFNFSAAALSPQLSFIPIMTDYCRQTDSTHGAPAPFDVVILGMGGDGHTASFFPDAENIADLVDPENKQPLLTCTSPSAQVDRITWSLPMLLGTELLALHITGEQKKQVFTEAAASDDALQLPIRSAIFQDQSQLEVYYAD